MRKVQLDGLEEKRRAEAYNWRDHLSDAATNGDGRNASKGRLDHWLSRILSSTTSIVVRAQGGKL